MATGDNAITPLFEPSTIITCRVTAAVGAGKFVAPSGNFEGGPALVVATPLVGGNLIQVAHCGAGLKALGVAIYDGATDGDPIPVAIGRGIWPVVSSGAIAAGAQVEVGAAGVAIALASGIAVGQAVSAAASNVCYVRIY